MELLFEIFLEIYGELMLLVVPETKTTSKLYRFFVGLIAATVFLGAIALFIWGGVLIVEQNNLYGWIPVAIAVILSAVQIILGFVLYNKHNRD